MKEQLLRSSCLLICSIFLLQVGLSQTTYAFVNSVGEPLIGVTAEVLEGNQVLISDSQGRIEILDAYIDMQLRCKYLGYSDQSIVPSSLLDNFIVMREDDTLLSTVEIIGRAYEREDLLPQRIEVIGSQEIASLQASTSADVMMQSGDVYVQKSQMGGGSPVMRGFEANKVLLVTDGVRMNNLIYRSGHLQNAITVDHSALEQMELIFGPGSLTYGSDALGGVIHFKTIAPRYDTKEGIGLNLQFTSANLGGRVNLIHRYGSDKFASATSVTLSRFDDLRSGQNRSGEYQDSLNYGLTNLYFDFDGNLKQNLNPHIQRNTGYNQYDIIQKFKFKLSNNSDLIFNAQLSSSSNIPRYDQLSQVDDVGVPLFRKWHYGPQNRLLLSPTLSYVKSNGFFDKMIAIASFQDVEETRIIQSLESAYTSTQTERVKVLGLTLDFTKIPTVAFNLQYGIDFHYNLLDSSVTNIDNDGNSAPAFTRYPDGKNTLYQMGAYVKGTYMMHDEKARITGGIRYSQQEVFMRYESDEVFDWPFYFYQGLKNHTNSLVGSLSLLYDFDLIEVMASAATGYRAPNTDDLAKIRIKTDEITIPNPNLSPEQTFNVEAGIQYHRHLTKIDVYGYMTWIENIILRDDGVLPNGSTNYITPDGLVYAVTTNINGASGIIRGISLSAEQEIIQNLNVEAKLNLLKGNSLIDGASIPIGHIPPLFGNLGLKYTISDYTINSNILFNGRKTIEEYGGSVDNPEYALPAGTPSWSIINLRCSRVKDDTQISLSIENLLDKFYRPFSSGVNGAGRSYNISIRYQI